MALSKPPRLLQSLVALLRLFFAALFLMLANKVYSQDSTTFSFNSFDPYSTDLIFEEDAHVPSASTFARLTKTNATGYPQKYSVGRVLYSKPVRLYVGTEKEAAFETNIRFRITPVNGIPADGIAFFIQTFERKIFRVDSEGSNLGIFSHPSGNGSFFAVEFDTYVNSECDPSYRHIGIDIYSRKSVKVMQFENTRGDEVHARIRYTGNTYQINVDAFMGSQQFNLDHTYSLNSPLLGDHVQVGISAATGAQVALHDILSWNFTSHLVCLPGSTVPCDDQDIKNGVH